MHKLGAFSLVILVRSMQLPLAVLSVSNDLEDFEISFHESTFQKFVMFLERCKGYEEDAKRFLFMSSETEDIQVTYKMV